MSGVTRIVGWLLFVIGVLAAFAEPHQGRMRLAVPGTILVAGEQIAAAIWSGKGRS